MLIDSHIHLPSINPWPGHEEPFPNVDQAIDYLKATGTNAAIFNTWQGVLGQTENDLETANADALKLTEQYNGFLFPGVIIHPAFPDASRRWLKTFREQGFPWVGELVSYQHPFNYLDQAFLDLCEICAEHNHILQLHCEKEIPALAQKFPSLKIICSHINAGLCPDLAAQPNIWLDISGSCGGLYIGGIESAYEVFGPDRLLYGTDFTGYDPRCFQIRLEVAVTNPDHRQKIKSKNLLTLLNSINATWNIPK